MTTKIFFQAKTWFLTGIILLLALSCVYIFQVTNLVHYTYLRDQYQRDLAQLQQDIKRVQITTSQNNSLTRVDNLVKNTNFQTVGDVDYVRALDVQVVSAEK